MSDEPINRPDVGKDVDLVNSERERRGGSNAGKVVVVVGGGVQFS